MHFLVRLKKKRYIQCGLALLLTGIFLYLTSSLWLSKEIIVSFDAESAENVVYRIYYAEKLEQRFNYEQSIKKISGAGKQNIKIILPINKLTKFRLDLDSQPVRVVLKNLRLIGSKKIVLNYNKFRMNQIDNYTINGEELLLSSNQNDPYIVYKPALNLPAHTKVNWYVLVIFVTLSFLGFNKLVRYLAKFKLEERYSRIDIVMLTVFFGLLWVPMCYISSADKSRQENRMLFKYKPFWQNHHFNYHFGSDFEDWYNDRFFGRDLALDFYNKLKYYIAPLSGNRKVLVGKNGWLFYKLDNAFNNFSNSTELSKESLENGLNFLASIDNWCKKNNIEFYFVIAPDKSKVYGENYRLVKKINPDKNGIGYQFTDYIKEHSVVKALYLRDELLKNKDKSLLYYKHDTHWNDLGAYYGYLALMNLMHMPTKNYKFVEGKSIHGLASMLHNLIDKDTEQYKHVKLKNLCKVDKKYASNVVCYNPKEKKRLFMLRDSFAEALIPYLSYNFKQIMTYHCLHSKFSAKTLEIIKDNADIFVLEIAERHIPELLNKTFPKNIKD